jgi:hypothetical protein
MAPTPARRGVLAAASTKEIRPRTRLLRYARNDGKRDVIARSTATRQSLCGLAQFSPLADGPCTMKPLRRMTSDLGMDRAATWGGTPVTVLTGFLGSGKTTLLRRALTAPAFADTAVVINEIGEIAIDHYLVDFV